MTWFMIDDGIYDSPQCEELPLSAIGLWALAGSYVGRQLRHGDYSNEQVVGQFAEHFDVLERRLVSQTFPMPADDVLAFARMTPLLFNVDVDSLDLSRIHELTVEAEILVGSVCG